MFMYYMHFNLSYAVSLYKTEKWFHAGFLVLIDFLKLASEFVLI